MAECKEAIISEDYVDFFMRSGSAFDLLVQDPDVCAFNLYENINNVYIPISKIPKNYFQVFGYGGLQNLYGLLDIESLDASGISRVQNIPALNLRGSGVLIGIVDSGIDYRHEAFIKGDGTSKILSIWDQSIDSPESQPEGFLYGTEYTQQQINTALTNADPISVVPSIDQVGHGTLLAGIAAGNPNTKERFSGVVPEAEIVAVKLKPAKRFQREFWRIPENVVAYQKNDLIMGVQYLASIARRENRPISIIIGIGTSQGGHDEKGSLSRFLTDLAANEGVCMSIAGGNEGNTGHHYLGFIKNDKTIDTVEISVAENVSGFSLEFWGETPSSFSIDIKSPNGEYIPQIPQTLKETKEIRFIFEETVVTVDYQLVEYQSGEQMVLIRFRDPTPGIWTFQVYLKTTISLNYHAWLPIENFLGRETNFIKSSPYYTLTSPGNTFIPIVTTAYDFRKNILYNNASRGYMRTNNIAPTLAAPGVDIIGPNIPSGYKASSGTSLSAAHLGGVGAILLEWGIVRKNYLNMSTVEIRNLLIRGAKRDSSLVYPNRDWGYGILDLYTAYDTFRSSIS